MAYVYRTYKTHINKVTGKREQVLDSHGKPIPHKYWRAEITGWDGNRRFITVPCSGKKDAQRCAMSKQAVEDQIRMGALPRPEENGGMQKRSIDEFLSEYIEHGILCGGRGGRPWSKGHLRTRCIRLRYWQDALKLKTLGDLKELLPRVEKRCAQRRNEGRAGKTISLEVEALRSFLLWMKKRKYIREDPLEGISRINTAPRIKKRGMTLEEIGKLLRTSPPHRSLLYETALCSGLRAGELRHLTPDHLDLQRYGLVLEAEWTKNRTDGFQPMPKHLMKRLAKYSRSGDALAKYNAAFRQSGTKLQCPTNPLLYVPRSTATTLDVDLKSAGIPKCTKQGKLDFHALRVTYINLLLDSGIDPKTTQTMARHSTLDLTMNIYARTTDERLKTAAENVGQLVFLETSPEPRYKKVNFKCATPGIARGCNEKILVPTMGHGLNFL